jgi:hypothetical protein
MEPLSAGQLVRLSEGGPALDGIVADTSSERKFVVAVMDPKRGPVLKSVDPALLSERADEGAADGALRGLIRRAALRTPGGGGAAGKGSVQARQGHKRSATHRTTGR